MNTIEIAVAGFPLLSIKYHRLIYDADNRLLTLQDKKGSLIGVFKYEYFFITERSNDD